MRLHVLRESSTAGATIGALSVDGRPLCWTLEDEVRPAKIPGRTAIPAGTYRVRLTPSPRFGVVLPELIAVPNYVGVRIHAGNRKEDTEGCLLVGYARGADWIGESRRALSDLMRHLAEADDEIWITIENRQEEGNTHGR